MISISNEEKGFGVGWRPGRLEEISKECDYDGYFCRLTVIKIADFYNFMLIDLISSTWLPLPSLKHYFPVCLWVASKHENCFINCYKHKNKQMCVICNLCLTFWRVKHANIHAWRRYTRLASDEKDDNDLMDGKLAKIWIVIIATFVVGVV